MAYYRELGLWFPPDEAPDNRGDLCINGPKMLEYTNDANTAESARTPLGTLCCTPGGYWAGY